MVQLMTVTGDRLSKMNIQIYILFVLGLNLMIIPSNVFACKLKSEITLEEMGVFEDNVYVDENGKIHGYKIDFSNATTICRNVGDALDSGYTMDHIRQDQLKQTPLY